MSKKNDRSLYSEAARDQYILKSFRPETLAFWQKLCWKVNSQPSLLEHSYEPSVLENFKFLDQCNKTLSQKKENFLRFGLTEMRERVKSCLKMVFR